MNQKLHTYGPISLILAITLFIVACGSTAAEPVVIEKEVVKEVIKEVAVEKEVIKEVPKEVVVIKEVVKEVIKEVPVTAAPAGPGGSTGITFWSDLAAGCEKRGGHLNVGNRVSEFTNLNPPTVNQVIQFSITAEVLSGLVQLDPKLTPVPDLAESWEVSPDGLSYVFKLRPNAKFHTGRPVTADDWVFTYDHQLDPATQSIHTKGLEGVNRPEKIDDLTLKISSAFPRASFLTKVVERASGRVMTLSDKETIAKVGEGGFNRMPVGAGPFRITKHVFGERLEFEAARDTFYDPSVPCLDSMTHFNIPEFNTLVAALETGEVDFIYTFSEQFWNRLDENPDIVVDKTPDVGFQMVAFNMRGDRAEKTGIKRAASKTTRTGLRIDARQDRPDTAFDHLLGEPGRFDAPERKVCLEAEGGDLALAVPAHILQEQVAERDPGDAVFFGVRQDLPNAPLIDLVGARVGQRYRQERQSSRLGLRRKQARTYTVHSNAVVLAVDRRQEPADLESIVSSKHMQCPRAVLPGAPREEDSLPQVSGGSTHARAVAGTTGAKASNRRCRSSKPPNRTKPYTA